MATGRRVGAETSTSRDRILDAVERLMLESGYAGVSYRAVATSAGVAPALVQYYFPTLDDLFVAAIERRSAQNLERLRTALRDRPEQPLRVLWESAREEVDAALTTEFLALGNHRKSIQDTIARVTEETRGVQQRALRSARETNPGDALSSPIVLAFLTSGIPKLIRLEEGVGVTKAHRDVVRAFERYLDEIEPVPRQPARRSRR